MEFINSICIGQIDDDSTIYILQDTPIDIKNSYFKGEYVSIGNNIYSNKDIKKLKFKNIICNEKKEDVFTFKSEKPLIPFTSLPDYYKKCTYGEIGEVPETPPLPNPIPGAPPLPNPVPGAPPPHNDPTNYYFFNYDGNLIDQLRSYPFSEISDNNTAGIINWIEHRDPTPNMQFTGGQSISNEVLIKLIVAYNSQEVSIDAKISSLDTIYKNMLSGALFKNKNYILNIYDMILQKLQFIESKYGTGMSENQSQEMATLMQSVTQSKETLTQSKE